MSVIVSSSELPEKRSLSEKRLLSVIEFSEYAGVGRNSALEFIKDNHIDVRIGRRLLADRVQFDLWCDKYHEEQLLLSKPTCRRRR